MTESQHPPIVSESVFQQNSDILLDRFDWPPKNIAIQEQPVNVSEASLPESKSTPQSLIALTIDSIETHLLGRTGLAFDRWVSQSGWKRDSTNVYCWRCGGSIGEHESDGEGCADCRTKSLPWDRAIRLGSYQGILRREVLTLKFHAWRPTGCGLGLHLGAAIKDQLERAQISAHQAVIVPVPMHRFRRVARGVDHTQVLASAASFAIGCPMLKLLKTKFRQEQVGLSMTARAENIRGAFSISKRNESRLKNRILGPTRVLILMDDVRTTGATFVAASKALRRVIRAQNKQNTGITEPTEIWISSVGVAGEGRRREGVAQR